MAKDQANKSFESVHMLLFCWKSEYYIQFEYEENRKDDITTNIRDSLTRCEAMQKGQIMS
jgi:hypothetical protein